MYSRKQLSILYIELAALMYSEAQGDSDRLQYAAALVAIAQGNAPPVLLWQGERWCVFSGFSGFFEEADFNLGSVPFP